MIEKTEAEAGYVDSHDNPNTCVYAGPRWCSVVTDLIDVWCHSYSAVAPSNAL
jgi:hypothetical protein